MDLKQQTFPLIRKQRSQKVQQAAGEPGESFNELENRHENRQRERERDDKGSEHGGILLGKVNEERTHQPGAHASLRLRVDGGITGSSRPPIVPTAPDDCFADTNIQRASCNRE